MQPAVTPTTHRSPFASGDVVDGRYRVDAFVGGGGMANVYRATHVLLDQPVALKVISASVRELPGSAERFLREAKAATRLKGAHFARVSDVGTLSDGAPYMVMEYLEGSDLGVVLETEEAIPVEDAVDYVLQACEALAEVHGLGIVHRDLKPGNLFLTRGADGLSCVKLIDFGISRMLVRGAVTLEHAANGLELSTSWTALDAPLTAADAVGLTQPETVMGSPRYMAPEQMESAARADSRSDLYGLGAVLYELLTKHAPHEGDTFLDLFAAVSLHPPVPPSTLRDGIPRELDKVILRCLKLDPAARYVDTAQLAAALAPFGPAGSTERAASIARILGASRRRASHTDSSPSSMHDSRVRRRASSSAYAVRRRLVRWGSAIALLALVVLATWGQALYARGETRGEPSPMPVPAVALPMALFVAPAPPPAPPTPVVLEARPVAPPPLVTALVAARTHVDERTLFEDRK